VRWPESSGASFAKARDAAAWPVRRQGAKTTPLANFAKHFCRVKAAMLDAINQPRSKGPVEGRVHRLNLIKRFMYGRASFDLLRMRFQNAT
jgi:transposase